LTLMQTYPAAIFEAFIILPGGAGPSRFRRKFSCPNLACEVARKAAGAAGRRRIGRQTITERIDPMAGYAVVGYAIERVELGWELIDLPDLPGGTLSFGLNQSVRGESPTPGKPISTPLHRAVPVLASVGDPYRVGRHDPARARGRGAYWRLALSGPKASGPFVVTCPDCRERCLVDGSLPDDELMHLSMVARKGPNLVV
jgi:hypothetical protein